VRRNGKGSVFALRLPGFTAVRVRARDRLSAVSHS
jgi:hypothetical protein